MEPPSSIWPSNVYMKRFLRKRTWLAALVLLGSAGAGRADTTIKQLGPGVTLTQEIDQKTPLIINVVTVDLTAPGVRVGVGIGQDRVSGTDATHGREDVSRIARRWGAVAAVNADYFPYTGDPLGVGIRNGELFSEPFLGIRSGGPRATVGIAPDGKSVLFDTLGFLGDLQARDGQRALISGINRTAGKNEIVAFSRLYGPQTGSKPGSVEAVVRGVNLPVRANKLLTGRVESVRVVQSASEVIPDDGVVISAGPGTGADFLAAHLHPGDPVSLALAVAPVGDTSAAFQIASLPRTAGDLPSRSGAALSRGAWLWAQVPEAVGGGPRLLVNGDVSVDWAAEGFDAGFAGGLNPRTAVGASRDGHRLYLVTVDGRQAFSRGVSLAGMAAILKRYGAWNAINLDGGGSTALAANGLTVSSPQGDGSERPVADMLLVYSTRAGQPDASAVPDTEAGQEGAGDAAPAAGPQIVVPSVPARVGSAVRLALQDGTRTVPGSSPNIIWQGPAGGVGFVNQKGYLIAQTPGTGRVTALYKGQTVTVPITVVGAAPQKPVYHLEARLVPDPYKMEGRSQLAVRVLDAQGKPQAEALIAVAVTLGTADTLRLKTDKDGSAVVGITWAAGKGGTVRVSSGTLAPIILTRL